MLYKAGIITALAPQAFRQSKGLLVVPRPRCTFCRPDSTTAVKCCSTPKSCSGSTPDEEASENSRLMVSNGACCGAPMGFFALDQCSDCVKVGKLSQR